MKTTQPFATRKAVAEYLALPPSTLAAWAHRGIGPKYTLIGRSARYAWSDVESWLSVQRVGGEQAAA